MLGVKEEAPDAERRLHAAVALFLSGCGVRKEGPPSAP